MALVHAVRRPNLLGLGVDAADEPAGRGGANNRQHQTTEGHDQVSRVAAASRGVTVHSALCTVCAQCALHTANTAHNVSRRSDSQRVMCECVCARVACVQGLPWEGRCSLRRGAGACVQGLPGEGRCSLRRGAGEQLAEELLDLHVELRNLGRDDDVVYYSMEPRIPSNSAVDRRVLWNQFTLYGSDYYGTNSC